MSSKRGLLESSLPIHKEDLIIRRLIRSDMDLLSRWPGYPWPYDVFRFSFCGLGVDELDRAYEVPMRSKNRIMLVVDTGKVSAIGYVALVQIDWSNHRSENMCFRIHPEFCDQGIGTRILIMIRDWWFGHGMNALRLDVAATNHRAVRCYLKAGFQKTGEFWRNAPDLINKNLSEEKYMFLGNHVNCESETPRILFYWMEAQNDQQSAASDADKSRR